MVNIIVIASVLLTGTAAPLRSREDIDAMLLRPNAEKLFAAYIKRGAARPKELIAELKASGFDYRKSRGCEYLYGGAGTGSAQATVTAFVWLCPHGVGSKVGYSPF